MIYFICNGAIIVLIPFEKKIQKRNVGFVFLTAYFVNLNITKKKNNKDIHPRR